MRNLYFAMNSGAQSSDTEIKHALEDLSNMEPELAAESAEILLITEHKLGYDAVHKQFSVFAELSMPTDFQDSGNRWNKRLVEFGIDGQDD